MNKKTIIIIISIILAVALIATGVILLLKNSFSENVTDKETGSNITSSSNEENSNEDSKTPSSENPSNSTDSSSDKPSEPTITVGSVEGKVGTKVKVPVSISSNPGFMAMIVDFNYDNTILDYKGYYQGDFLTEYQFNDIDGNLRFLTVENDNVTQDGILVYLEFEIISSKQSKADIDLVIKEDSIANKSEQLITVKDVDGSVTIKK